MQKPRHLRRISLAGVALVLGASLLAVSAPPAGADIGIQGCWKPGRWVVFEHINSNYWGTSPANMNCWNPGTKTNMPSNMNDRVSSLENNTDQAACFWEHADQQGHRFVLGAQSHIANLTAYSFPGGGNWNDRISSIGPC